MKYLILCLMLVGCATQPVEKPVENPAPVVETPVVEAPVELAWAKNKNSKQWTGELFEVIKGAPLVKYSVSDIGEFCPKYDSLNEQKRLEFWAQLISVMAKYESNFKPGTTYTEDMRDAQGRPVVSRGLLQISIESGNGYGCGIKSEQDLHKSLENLNCGGKILTKLVGQDKRLAGKNEFGKWQGGARYWAVLRGSTKYTKEALAGIKSYLNGLALCK